MNRIVSHDHPPQDIPAGAAGATGWEYSTPSAALGPHRLWTAWQAYRQGEERILARAGGLSAGADDVADVEASPTEVVTPEPGLHCSPFVGLIGQAPVVAWLHGRDGGHTVVAAPRVPTGWSAPVPVSQSGRPVVSLHAASDGHRLWAAWCEADAPQTFTIWVATYDGHTWQRPVQVAAAPGWVQRPEVAAAPGGCWVAWDAYDGQAFAVWAAFVGDGGAVIVPPQRVSPPPAAEGSVTPRAWQFVPSLCVDPAGTPWVAWLCLQDVANEDGVIDQWPTARVAWLTASGWELVHDGAGSADLARLAWGLLSWEKAGVWGYLGRRRKPLVVADPVQGAWFLWERKELHDGRTGIAKGVLCARRLDPGPEAARGAVAVGPMLRLATGSRWYVPARITLAPGRRRLWLAARTDPAVSTNDVFAAAYDLDNAPVFEGERAWPGWKPVTLHERRPDHRPTVQHAGKEYQLYWADLHVHTTLSGDAEGHLDEIIAYGRDKACLDCMAISDNDWSHFSLTDSDWEIYSRYVRHFHQDGTFVLLPAYEWTYRPHGHRPNAANHRTVVGVDETLPILRHQDVLAGDPMAALAAHAERYRALLHLHHERGDLTDSPAETNVEVCSGWGVHMRDPVYVQKLHGWLAAGRRVGFVGNSDNHRRNPGLGGALTGIYAAALTRGAILDALRHHRCFATDGSRTVVRFRINETFMGGEVMAAAAPVIRWEVACPAAPATVTLVRDGEPVQAWTMSQRLETHMYVDHACSPGDHFYYLAAEQQLPWRPYPSNVAIAWGPGAWSSPIWVRRTG